MRDCTQRVSISPVKIAISATQPRGSSLNIRSRTAPAAFDVAGMTGTTSRRISIGDHQKLGNAAVQGWPTWTHGRQ